jgi:hypothetical protein
MDADGGNLAAGFTYADAGLYIMPVEPGTKHPGSRVGRRWQDKSSRDHDCIAAWFAGSDDGIAIDLGRSGLVVLDIDHPELLPPWLQNGLGLWGAPYQSTRPDSPGRGHYVFRQPPGRRIGCSKGLLTGMGLDVKGDGGVIITQPTQHPEGGEYRWVTSGDIPELLLPLVEMLSETTTDRESAATDAEVAAFLAAHTGSERPRLFNTWPPKFAGALVRLDSRHIEMARILPAVAEESKAGYYPARQAFNKLRAAFVEAKTRIYNGEAPLSAAAADHAFDGILAWAIGQAERHTVASIRAKVENNLARNDLLLMPAAGVVDPSPASESEPAAATAPRIDNGGGRLLLASKLLTRSALKQLPKPAPLIDNVLDQGTVALLYGKWGTGKSFIALDWGASVATGRRWQGRTTEKRRVLYIAAEGAFGLQARVAAWEIGWQQTIGEDDLHILPEAVNLTNPDALAELIELVTLGQYGLVIIDTLARCMVGADENSAKDCGEVVDALDRMRIATPEGLGVIAAVHHTGKDGKTFRGSSVFEGGADTVYSVIEDGGAITLDREKRKDGPKDDEHTLRLDTMAESCVVGIHRDGGHLDSGNRSEVLLALFAEHFSETGATGPRLYETAQEAIGMSRTTAQRALNDLLARKKLRPKSIRAVHPLYVLCD